MKTKTIIIFCLFVQINLFAQNKIDTNIELIAIKYFEDSIIKQFKNSGAKYFENGVEISYKDTAIILPLSCTQSTKYEYVKYLLSSFDDYNKNETKRLDSLEKYQSNDLSSKAKAAKVKENDYKEYDFKFHSSKEFKKLDSLKYIDNKIFVFDRITYHIEYNGKYYIGIIGKNNFNDKYTVIHYKYNIFEIDKNGVVLRKITLTIAS